MTPAELGSLDQGARSGRLGRVLEERVRQIQWETLEKDGQDLTGWRGDRHHLCSFNNGVF